MDPPVVKTSDGYLKGSLMTDYDGGKIYAFRGIPYAKPPIGDLRFKAPLPIDPWEDVKDAISNGDKCIQRDYYTKAKGMVEGSENCLHLNVYTKELPDQDSAQLKPVMVWIHGGGFHNGSNRSEMFGPEYLLTEDVVLVSVNYRLGILGFLQIKDPAQEIYGNAGLKDQQLALKWVQKNIQVFNGDPTNVTIFGESAGSASVHFHVLSPFSQGLFHRAILQSGTAINIWASLTDQPISLVEFTNFLDQSFSNEAAALNYLKSVNVEELYIAQEKYILEKSKSGILLVFTPLVETINETAFLTDTPANLVCAGQFNQVPMMFGYTSAEGLFFIIDRKMKISRGVPIKRNDPQLEDFLPLTIRQKESPEKIQELCDKMRNVYKDDQFNIQLLSDFFFLSGIISSVKYHAKASNHPVYLYRMDLDDDLNLIKKMDPMLPVDIPGMSHADDQGYIFWNENIPVPKRGSTAETAMRRIVKLWTNFAKFGTPIRDESEFNVLWESATEDAMNFLNIGPELTSDINPDEERMKLWEEILELAEKS